MSVRRLGWVAMGIYAIGVPLGYMILLITIYPELRERQKKLAAEKAALENAQPTKGSSARNFLAKLGRSFRAKATCSSMHGSSVTSRSCASSDGDDSSCTSLPKRGDRSFAAFARRDERDFSTGRSAASKSPVAGSTDRRVTFIPASPPPSPPDGGGIYAEPSCSQVDHTDEPAAVELVPTQPPAAASPLRKRRRRTNGDSSGRSRGSVVPSRGSVVQIARERRNQLAQARAAVSTHLHLMEALEFLWEDYEVRMA